MLGAALTVGLLTLSAPGGCVLAPDGLDQEAHRAERAGTAWQDPFGERTLPELPSEPSWRDVVASALIVHGGVEAAWHDWQAAIRRVEVEAGWPNTNLAVELSAALDGGMSLWERATLGLGFDPMEMLALPTKLRQAGRVALQEARAAGHRFDAARLAVRREVLSAFLDYAVWQERVAAQQQVQELAALALASTAARVQAGAPLQSWLEASITRDAAQSELLALQAEGPGLAARLNALLGRPPEAPLPTPALPEPRLLPADDALLAAGVHANPELAALAAEIAARGGNVRGQRQRLLPDVAPSFEASGGGAESAGVMFSIPVALPSLRAAVDAARAELLSAEAAARQAGLDTAAAFVATLAALRAAERQVMLLDGTLRPAAEQLARNADQAYATGAAGFDAPLDARRMALQARVLLAEARAARELRLAELEELAGRELEPFDPQATASPTSTAGESP